MSSVTLRWLSKKCKVANKQGNEAKPGLTRKNENPARACDVERAPARAGSREPSWCGRYEGLCYEGSASQTQGRAKGSPRNVWFEFTTMLALLSSIEVAFTRRGVRMRRSFAAITALACLVAPASVLAENAYITNF